MLFHVALNEFSFNRKNLDVVVSDLMDAGTVSKEIVVLMHGLGLAMLKTNEQYRKAVSLAPYVLADGVAVSLVNALCNGRVPRITGYDFFYSVMTAANVSGDKVFFLGGSVSTLEKLRDVVGRKWPNVSSDFYSPPFKNEFSDEETREMVRAINLASPKILWVGLSAPKQEIWLSKNSELLDFQIGAGIGAVFDFMAGTVRRAPSRVSYFGLEWLYRGFRSPKQLIRRNLFGFPILLWILAENIYRRYFARKS